MRTELAKRIVQLSKENVRDEGSLAEAGHLRQLTFEAGEPTRSLICATGRRFTVAYARRTRRLAR